ncbi:hypothetical protein J27TS7_06920 [Paenibacillus dendritiformis]|nr:hypothetical protein J27TS7_06920 [Paenibacillus dendritiformis]
MHNALEMSTSVILRLEYESAAFGAIWSYAAWGRRGWPAPKYCWPPGLPI